MGLRRRLKQALWLSARLPPVRRALMVRAALATVPSPERCHFFDLAGTSDSVVVWQNRGNPHPRPPGNPELPVTVSIPGWRADVPLQGGEVST